MATANRLKKLRQTQPQQTKQSQSQQYTGQFMPTSHQVAPYRQQNHPQNLQEQFQSYTALKQCNPQGIIPTSNYFPYNQSMKQKCNITMGFQISPILSIYNQCGIMNMSMNRSADQIPRCDVCRAYMNCYNTISMDKKKFGCFLCKMDNKLPKYYHTQNQQYKQQLKSSIFQALSPINYYKIDPSPDTYIFMMDISQQSTRSGMLTYAISAMKQVLSRQDLQDVQIYFYGFDQFVHQYYFSQSNDKYEDNNQVEPQCVIWDPSIGWNDDARLLTTNCWLGNIRNSLFKVLDSLQQKSRQNTRTTSNFNLCFTFILRKLKHTGGRFFILQSNQNITSEPLFWQQVPLKKSDPNMYSQTISKIPSSFFETRNKSFFNNFLDDFLQAECSCNIFIFAQNYKNVKILNDCMKITGSDIKVYTKGDDQELKRFYYQFAYFLGTSYYRNVYTEFIICRNWYFTSVYGNVRKLKQAVSFVTNWHQATRKIAITVAPTKYSNSQVMPYCCIQVATNYRYKRQSYICVGTIVQPVTGYLHKLYKNIDSCATIGLLAKIFLSNLRTQHVNKARNNLLTACSKFYTSTVQYFKKYQKIPYNLTQILKSVLSIIKSLHGQPQNTHNMHIFDKIISERSVLQSCSLKQLAIFFNPYLFDVTQFQEQMCQFDQNGYLQYPNTVEIKFGNTKQGIYLMDDGLCLYLYITRTCPQRILIDLFGKASFSRNYQLTQQLIFEQDNPYAIKLQNLIKYLREQKIYGWIPLRIIRAGQNSLNQRNYCMHYTMDKYEEFRVFKVNYQEFLKMLAECEF